MLVGEFVVFLPSDEWAKIDEELLVGRSAIDEVLDDQHPEPVAVVIPPLRLDFDVFPDHVKAKALGEFDVIDHRLVARWR